MRMSFRFRLIPFIATLVVAGIGVALGQWQDRRAAEKIALQAHHDARQREAPAVIGAALMDPKALQDRRVTVSGEFERDWPLYLENRPYNGRVGFYVLMPLRISGSNTHVLIGRGWAPRDTEQRNRVPKYNTPRGLVTIEGNITTSLGHVMQLGTPPPVQRDAILQNLEVGQVAEASKLTLQPFFIEQLGGSDAGDDLVRDWPKPSLGVEKHQGYAFQWYALSVTALLFFIVTGFIRASKSSKPS
jgi:surfeit locus 1 family protein